MIKIDFEITKDEYTYRDAIILPEDHSFTEAEIEEMKQQRFDNWYNIVTNPTSEAPILEEPIESEPQE